VAGRAGGVERDVWICTFACRAFCFDHPAPPSSRSIPVTNRVLNMEPMAQSSLDPEVRSHIPLSRRLGIIATLVDHVSEEETSLMVLAVLEHQLLHPDMAPGMLAGIGRIRGIRGKELFKNPLNVRTNPKSGQYPLPPPSLPFPPPLISVAAAFPFCISNLRVLFWTWHLLPSFPASAAVFLSLLYILLVAQGTTSITLLMPRNCRK
jgi:hypothetical protein